MPPRATSADKPKQQQTPAQLVAAIEDFLSAHPDAAVLEDGKVLFELRAEAADRAQYALSTDHNRCTLHLWNAQRNLVRRIVSATPRAGVLRLATARFGHAQTKLLELAANRERRTPSTREATRTRYLAALERILLRALPEWKADGFRTAMDLEKSFGPAYARGSLIRGRHAWAVIAVNESETAAIVDGILTLGVLWLDYCREHAAGRRLYQGLILIVPRGMAMLTLSRLAWMNTNAAQWRLFEFDANTGELTERDPADQGNLRTRLIHHPDEAAARERFANAIEQVLSLVPPEEHSRIEQRLRSSAELAFLLHGLEFARARVRVSDRSFTHIVEITAGVGEQETALTDTNRAQIAAAIAELLQRRRAGAEDSTRDPLFRATPERWLESVLRQDLAPLTRHLAAQRKHSRSHSDSLHAHDADPDTIGNRAESAPPIHAPEAQESRIVPRLDSAHVYAQVPAIAGAGDRGMLDLLGVTADGRLAVIELKADEDLHFALQGLDYWIRVRHHHLQSADTRTGLGEFQRHGYFRGVELSPLPPRLYLVAPALRVHPATEIVLRYISPRVEWNLLALDEHWRSRVRVVWRKHSM